MTKEDPMSEITNTMTTTISLLEPVGEAERLRNEVTDLRAEVAGLRAEVGQYDDATRNVIIDWARDGGQDSDDVNALLENLGLEKMAEYVTVEVLVRATVTIGLNSSVIPTKGDLEGALEIELGASTHYGATELGDVEIDGYSLAVESVEPGND